MSVTSTNKVNIVIPMAGLGKRFSDVGYSVPKPLLPLGNKTMIEAVIDNLYYPTFNFIIVANEHQIDITTLTNLLPEVTIVPVNYVPCGPAKTVLHVENLINNNDPLFIVNCDQIIEDFSYVQFENICNYNEVDGVIGVFHSTSPKNSYVRINDNTEVIEVREKQVISNIATNGLHYWSRGKYFVESAYSMITNKETYNNEYYVAPSYNYMVNQGMKVMPYYFNMHFPIGIPVDYENYKTLRNL